ncbi:MAG: ABC-2 family transporter protein [Lachnospiraceae bacterium]|nr:ABC transporter permease [Lachnospiraceae bacterium]MDD7147027.1 ABC-2 family transporter protein [Lachnospiraceae bacterium]MDY4070407.1 ABC-2 family transporter protein [Lachnospiraceae bacterium]
MSIKKTYSTLAHYLSVTIYSIKMALLTIVEYPSNILGWLLSNPIQFLLGFAAIRFAVEQFGEINGWNYGQLAFLYGISVISHALSMIFFVQGWFMGFYVIEGEFDRFLTRPMSVLYQFFFTNINVFGLTDLIPGILVFLYGCVKTDFPFTVTNVVGILVMLTGAVLIRGGIYILLGSTSFWTKSANDFGQFTQEIFDKTTMYPLSMYPESLQLILTFLIPIGWVSFYPTSELLGIEHSFSTGNMGVWITLGVGIITMLITGFVFQTGLKQYESAGN